MRTLHEKENTDMRPLRPVLMKCAHTPRPAEIEAMRLTYSSIEYPRKVAAAFTVRVAIFSIVSSFHLTGFYNGKRKIDVCLVLA